MKKYAMMILTILSIAGMFFGMLFLNTFQAGREGIRQKYAVEEENKSEEEDMSEYALAECLIVPTLEEVSENPYIYRYNHELCKEKGLMGEGGRLSRHYLCMQAVYRANLDAYLLDVLDLRRLDEELKDSSLGFACPEPEHQNLYKKESTMDLKYICLRNNLYIEYLDKDQLSLLKRQLESGREAVSDEIQKMVKETYREVLRVRKPGDWNDTEGFLYAQAQGRKPEIPNQALVLEIANAMVYDAAGNLLSDDHMKEKCEYLDRVKLEKEKEYSEILGTEVYILVE